MESKSRLERDKKPPIGSTGINNYRKNRAKWDEKKSNIGVKNKLGLRKPSTKGALRSIPVREEILDNSSDNPNSDRISDSGDEIEEAIETKR